MYVQAMQLVALISIDSLQLIDNTLNNYVINLVIAALLC